MSLFYTKEILVDIGETMFLRNIFCFKIEFLLVIAILKLYCEVLICVDDILSLSNSKFGDIVTYQCDL